jgi:hypothetical protein
MSEYQVRATLDGRMAEMRHLFMVRGPDGRARPVTSPMESVEFGGDDRGATYLSAGGMSGPYPCPLGVPGDHLWVKETWGTKQADHPRAVDGRPPTPGDALVYRADPGDAWQWRSTREGGSPGGFVWRSSTHMPSWASRLTLEVTGVRVERLQDLSEEDAQAEGIQRGESSDPAYTWIGAPERREGCGPGKVAYCHRTARDAYRTLWNHLNGKRATWESNPWVWVVAFSEAKA